MTIFGTPTVVGTNGYPLSSATATINTSVGDLIVGVLANVFSSPMGTVTVSDSAGNSYTVVPTINQSGLPSNTWFYCLAATHASASNVVTANSGSSGFILELQVWDVPITGGPPVFDWVAPTTANYTQINSPGYAYPNGSSGTDEFICVAVADPSRTTTYGPAGFGYTLDPLTVGTYPAGLGTEHGVFANPNTIPTLLQDKISINGATSGTVTITLPNNVVAGSNIMVAFDGSNGTVTDSQSNHYYSAPSNSGSINCYFASATSSGSLTVTISGVSAGSFFNAVVCEIGGTTGMDAAAGHTTTASNQTITLNPTHSPNELIVTIDVVGAPGSTVTFTQSTSTIADQAGNSTNGYLVVLTDQAAAAGSHTAAVTASQSIGYAMTAFSFYGSGSPWMRWTGSGDYVSAIGFKAPPPPAATPTFSPDAGTYGQMQTVTMACTTPGSSIFYTVDGSTPTSGSTPYSAPVSFAYNITLKAIATASGFSNSAVKSSAYVYTSYNGLNLSSVATDNFSPNANPLNPANWAVWTDPSFLGSLQALSGFAVASAATSGLYGNDYIGTTLAADQYVQADCTMTLGDPTIELNFVARDDGTGAGGYFVTILGNADGLTTVLEVGSPTLSLAIANNFFFKQADPFTFAVVGTNVFLLENGVLLFGPLSDSSVASGKVGIGGEIDTLTTDFKFSSFVAGSAALNQVATPTFSPGGGGYPKTVHVTISCATGGASIFYTTDGSTPTSSSTPYTTPIAISANTTLKAIATLAGAFNSNVATALYVVPAGGSLSQPFNINRMKP